MYSLGRGVPADTCKHTEKEQSFLNHTSHKYCYVLFIVAASFLPPLSRLLMIQVTHFTQWNAVAEISC